MQDLITNLAQVVGTWQEAGALAALVALINLIVWLTKAGSSAGMPPWVNKLVGWIKPAWRPWLSLGLGALAGFLGGLAADMPLGKALSAGVVAGLSAIGVHQAAVNTLPSETAKREASAAVKEALSGPEAEVKAKVDALKAVLDAAVALPDKQARLKALADLASGAK